MSNFVDIHTHQPLGTHLGLRSIRLGKEPFPSGEHISLGIHPWDVAEGEKPTLLLLQNAECEAVGEIGLDKLCNVPFALQEHFFEEQLLIAERRNLPVVIHCTRAYNEVLRQLAPHPGLRCIFHGYIGSSELLGQIVKRGYFVSFGFGALRSPKTIEALRACPPDKLFLESDEEPTPIEALYTEVAALKEMALSELKQEINNNYKRIFL